MGLDMYLEARIYGGQYLGTEYYHMLKALPIDWPGQPESFEISATIAYWRKANAIHGWFVDTVQGGEDDCRGHGVTLENLIALRDLCDKVLTVHTREAALEFLPPTGGFFFGSTDVGEHYWSDLRDTITKLSPIINSPLVREYKADLIYRSSW